MTVAEDALTRDREILELRALARRVSGRLVATPEDAEDIAQEAVFRVTQQWDRVRAYARPWVVRVATNLAIAQMRRDGRAHPIAVDMGPDEHADLRVDLAVAVQALPVRQRQAVVLRYLADHDEATVASLLGCSRGSVKRHLHRAVRALRESPRLATTPTEGVSVSTSTHWKDHGFIAAVEPPGGWPARPWDHWFIEHGGSWDRVAVDGQGEPILDADGDEVMSGPGFDHQVVKVVPGLVEDSPDQRSAWTKRYLHSPSVDHRRVTDLLDGAERLAGYFGHPWVGDEHLGMALADAEELPGVAADELRQAVADFYEGSWAAARLAIVAERASGSSFRRQPDANFSWTWALGETFGLAQRRRKPLADAPPLTHADIADALMTKERSLIRTLLTRRYA